MSVAGRAAFSAAMGVLVAVSAFALTSLANAALDRWRGATVFASMARRSLLRMLGAVAGVAAGVRMDPPSIPVFVVAFLAFYLGVQTVLIVRAGGARSL